MKRIVNSKEVYHLWAHQTQNYARSHNGNVSFDGVNAFSYGACIGKIVTAPKGEKVFILSRKNYSVTTSGHESMCISAAYGNGIRFITDVDFLPKHTFNPQDFLNEMLKELPAMALKVKRARQSKEWRQSELQERIATCREFARLFRLSAKNMPASTELPADLVQRISEAEEKRVKAENAKRLKENKEKLAQWLAGERVCLQLPTAYLRISPNSPTDVETSMGAVVPLAHIQAVKELVLAYIRDKREYKRNGHTIHLGYYSLDSISKDGTVRAGCHTFTRSEILRFAALI